MCLWRTSFGPRNSACEAFGIAIVEAMSLGCVPVVLRAGGPWHDILGDTQGK